MYYKIKNVILNWQLLCKLYYWTISKKNITKRKKIYILLQLMLSSCELLVNTCIIFCKIILWFFCYIVAMPFAAVYHICNYFLDEINNSKDLYFILRNKSKRQKFSIELQEIFKEKINK